VVGLTTAALYSILDFKLYIRSTSKVNVRTLLYAAELAATFVVKCIQTVLKVSSGLNHNILGDRCSGTASRKANANTLMFDDEWLSKCEQEYLIIRGHAAGLVLMKSC
jgi:hypothetical protein